MTDLELQKLVEDISSSSFHKPFVHKATFNPRLRTTGGRYLLQSHNIEINKQYLDQLGMEELEGIIKHELCHYHLHIEGRGYKHKDKDFKSLLKAVGGARYCSVLPQSRKRSIKTTYLYSCKQCHQTYKRKRKVNTVRYVCGKCAGKLVLIDVNRIE